MREDDGRFPVTAGTAGHVDHGKTALVKALTGVDTDRLAEEKSRGLSIELGFAALELPSGRPASIVDVPGHERFIRNMVAGASGIDCFLMVVAADEGVRPQTIEHAAILRALGIEHGLVAITKADRCDPAAACQGAAELLPGRPVVPCSARTGAGLSELLAALERVAAMIPARPRAAGPAVLHIDRSFTVAGHGTVVTGTLSTGTVSPGDRLVVEPQGTPARVRGVEVHGQRRDRAVAGERVAVNLAHLPAGAAGRGDALAGAGALRAAYVLEPAADDELAGALAPIGDRSVPVTVHHGTAVTTARLTRAGGETIRLRCRRPLLARAGDRVVVRSGAPLRTLGGAVVPAAPPSPAEPAPRAAPPRAPSPPPPLSPEAIQLAAELRAAGLRPPSDRELGERAALLAPLEAHQLVVRLAHGRHAHVEAVEHARLLIARLTAADGSVTLPALRDAIGGSRGEAKAFLDHLHETGFTRRRRDRAHVVRPRQSPR